MSLQGGRAMKAKTVFLLVILALMAILAFQNSELRDFKLFFWPIYTSMFILILIGFLGGIVAGFLIARRERKKERKKQEEKPVQTPSPKS
jgi:uncharacterized integral membrane protein